MAIAKPNLIVEIDKEQYRLDVVPAAQSKLVVTEREKLLGAVDLRTLVDDLGRIGAFIRIAYNGVGAAGPKFTDMQIDIQRLGYDVTKLCDKSALTVSTFKKASATVLTDLQATYEYLLDNLEELAIETLSSVSKIAEDMERAAFELHKEFDEEEKKVETALEKTQTLKGAQAQHIIDKRKEREQLQEKHKEQLELMEDAQRLEREAEANRRQSELKEDQAIRGIAQANDPLKQLANAFTSPFGVKLFNKEVPEKQAQLWKEKRIEALKKENEFRQQRYEALNRMTTFASQIKACQTEENMADTAEKALHETISALKELSAVMMQAVQFWNQMQKHCKSLAEDKMAATVKTAMDKYTDEKRLKVWTSNGFKIKAVQFYAGWVALSGVCTEYVEHIKDTQKDLYAYLRENPTYEESRKNIKTLAEEFLKNLKEDQKAIADKEFETQEKIKELSNSTETK